MLRTPIIACSSRPATVVTAAVVAGMAAVNVAATAQTCDVWSEMTAPNPDASRAAFNGLAVIAPADVWAVGMQRAIGAGTDPAPLSAHFDGTAWTLVPVPNPAWSFDRQAWLYAVDAAASNDVWAVGAFIHPGEADLETFAVHFDGAEWTWVESPTQANGSGSMFVDVDVVGPDDVWACGAWPGQLPGVDLEPLAAHWDGQGWTVTPVPAEIDDTRMHEIETLTPTDIWAIGNIEIATAGPLTPQIWHFDGQGWEFADPRPPAEYQGTDDLAVVATDDVWVSARRWNDADIFSPIPVFLHWDGSTWTEYLSPGGNRFVVNAPDDIRAVSANAVSRWDGSSWTLVSETNLFPDDPFAFLNDVAAYDGCAIWGAGKKGVADDMRTMLLETGAAGCAADLTGPEPGTPDGNVDALDFLLLIAQWGTPCAGSCAADITGGDGAPDGNVDALDFLLLIAQWGTPGNCPLP